MVTLWFEVDVRDISVSRAPNFCANQCINKAIFAQSKVGAAALGKN